MQSREEGTRFLLLAPIPKRKGRTLEEQLQIYLQQGFTRIVLDKEIIRIEEYTPKKGEKPALLVDRLTDGNPDRTRSGHLANSGCLLPLRPTGFPYWREIPHQ